MLRFVCQWERLACMRLLGIYYPGTITGEGLVMWCFQSGVACAYSTVACTYILLCKEIELVGCIEENT